MSIRRYSDIISIFTYSIFYKAVDKVQSTIFEFMGRSGIMSTYEEFMIILNAGLLIVAILNLKNKK